MRPSPRQPSRLSQFVAFAVAPLLFTAGAHALGASTAPAIEKTTAKAATLSLDELATIRAEALRAFRSGDYASLENTAARLRADRPRTTEGDWALAYFYDSFSPKNIGLNRLEALAHFTSWERSPVGQTSPTRAAAAALYWRSQNTTGASQEDRVAWSKARSAALKNDIPDSACPHLAIERHLRLTSREADRDRANEIYSAASAANPGYAPMIEAHAGWLSGFAASEVGPWLAAECDKLAAPARDEIYAMVAISRPRSASDWVAQRQLDWPRIQRGLESFHQRWPAAPGTLDKLAQAAESHGDRLALGKALRRIQTAPDRPTWSNNKGYYLSARRQAGLEPASDLRPVREIDLELRGYRVAFSPDGAVVIVGCAKGEILAFSSTDLTPLWQLKCPRWVSSLSVSPDGRLVCATGGNVYDKAGDGGGVWVWEIATGELLASDTKLPQRLVASAFSPDGRTLWAAGGTGKKSLVLRWSPGDASFTRVATPAELGGIKAAAATNDAGYFSASQKVWRFPAANDSAPDVIHEGKSINAIALSPDGRTLALGDWNANSEWKDAARLRRLDLSARANLPEPVAPIALDAAGTLQGTRIEAVAFSRSGLLAAASSGGDFAVWRAYSAARPRHSGWVSDAWTIDDLALSPDGRFAATVDTSGHLRIWDLTTPSKTLAGRRWPAK